MPGESNIVAVTDDVESMARMRESSMSFPRTQKEVKDATDNVFGEFLKAFSAHSDEADLAVSSLIKTLDEGFFAADSGMYESIVSRMDEVFACQRFEKEEDELAACQFVIDLFRNLYNLLYRPVQAVQEVAPIDAGMFQERCLVDPISRDLTLFGVAAFWAKKAIRRFYYSPEITSFAHKLSFKFEQEEKGLELPDEISIRHPITEDTVKLWQQRQVRAWREGFQAPAIADIITDIDANLDYTLNQEIIFSGNEEYCEACEEVVAWLKRVGNYKDFQVKSDDDLSSMTLFLNTYEEQRQLFRALFVIKQHNLELYIKILGEVPGHSHARNSEFFGNTLHLVLANTGSRLRAAEWRDSDDTWLEAQMIEAVTIEEKDMPYLLRISQESFSENQLKYFMRLYREQLQAVASPEERTYLNTFLLPVLLPTLINYNKARLAEGYHDKWVEKLRRIETADPDEFIEILQSLTGSELNDPEIKEVVLRRSSGDYCSEKTYKYMIGTLQDRRLRKGAEDIIDGLKETVLQNTPPEVAARWILEKFMKVDKGVRRDIVKTDGNIPNIEKNDELMDFLDCISQREDIAAEEWYQAYRFLVKKYKPASFMSRGFAKLERLVANNFLVYLDVPIEFARFAIRLHGSGYPGIVSLGKEKVFNPAIALLEHELIKEDGNLNWVLDNLHEMKFPSLEARERLLGLCIERLPDAGIRLEYVSRYIIPALKSADLEIQQKALEVVTTLGYNGVIMDNAVPFGFPAEDEERLVEAAFNCADCEWKEEFLNAHCMIASQHFSSYYASTLKLRAMVGSDEELEEIFDDILQGESSEFLRKFLSNYSSPEPAVCAEIRNMISENDDSTMHGKRKLLLRIDVLLSAFKYPASENVSVESS